MKFKDILWVFFISILPIVELRGAIPVGAGLGLHPVVNAAVAIAGNLLPVPFILFFIPKILDLMERIRWLAPIVRWVRRKADKHKGKIIAEDAHGESVAPLAQDTAEPCSEASDAHVADTSEDAAVQRRQKGRTAGVFTALMLFVMIPLPGTGAWTGALIASLVDVPKKTSFPAIILGVLGAAVIMSLASYGVVSFLKIFM